MKPKAINRIFVLGIFVVLAFHSFSQEIPAKDSLPSDCHMQKSKSQKIAGFILLGAGATTLAVLSKGETDFNVLPVLAIGGLAATVLSIPLFISAGKNKRKALSLSVKKEKTFQVRNGTLSQRSFPAVSIRIPIGR